MFKEQGVWNGLATDQMTDVYSMIESTNYKSPVAPPKPNRKLMKAARELGKGLSQAIGREMEKANISITQRYTGMIKKFHAVQGYGFLTVTETGEDLFYHIKETVDPELFYLSHGEVVSFEINKDKKGRRQAAKIVLVEGRGR